MTIADSTASEPVVLTGDVTSGERAAEDFLSLSGYVEQFRSRLGYEPYPGTLNVELDATSRKRWDRTVDGDGGTIRIDPWSDGDREFGGASCYRAAIVSSRSEKTAYSTCHLIVPDRTTHGPGTIELVAPDRLRDRLELADGTTVTVNVR
ncbi:DUF120 domain-containing protein [Natrarchaeobius chitinivorans]|uniref:Riboflavin kinase n=1 Tax=Natrarchaeobius chitinivorans TaxID=1679083 RepID=A0A3N6M4I8_NATCH|nr:DUF120 domain-containing protein [Natrarchaeobius chitinivorans]RQG95404.1 CTP-dependent riboflavin kinase [Natrarchaeobius chitinivorans]